MVGPAKKNSKLEAAKTNFAAGFEGSDVVACVEWMDSEYIEETNGINKFVA